MSVASKALHNLAPLHLVNLIVQESTFTKAKKSTHRHTWKLYSCHYVSARVLLSWNAPPPFNI